ncbi:hypothetical protein AAFF_G00060630 [Aldrovandia affinis]|uniref:Uncharacterized protein n=1 Tax=Aldrovandia affinis TaxID=143900 RepID=A0AAD7R3W0_9TELE|nr:hypothetical protein AAFF_G00060630 [Aldrovandia affinis]
MGDRQLPDGETGCSRLPRSAPDSCPAAECCLLLHRLSWGAVPEDRHNSVLTSVWQRTYPTCISTMHTFHGGLHKNTETNREGANYKALFKQPNELPFQWENI